MPEPMYYSTGVWGFLGLLVVFFVGIPLASAVSAVFLRLAVWICGGRRASYVQALRSTVTTNYTVVLLHSLLYWYLYWCIQDYEGRVPPQRMMSFIPRSLFEYTIYIVGIVLVHAVLFARLLNKGDTAPMPFGDAIGVTLVYIAFVFFLFGALYGTVVFAILTE